MAPMIHISEVVEIMLEKDLKRFPATRNKRLVGVIERSSLSKIVLKKD